MIESHRESWTPISPQVRAKIAASLVVFAARVIMPYLRGSPAAFADTVPAGSSLRFSCLASYVILSLTSSSVGPRK